MKCDICGHEITGKVVYIPKVTVDGLIYVPICIDCLYCATDLATPALKVEIR